MKKISFICLFLLWPVVGQAQYWGERVTEQSFEQSTLYFQKYFYNTYGLYRFADVTPGLIDDPFLNLAINPANLPKIRNGSSLLYFDFRDDHEESEIVTTYNHYYPGYYDYIPYPDYRWYSRTRGEPEPIFSVGLLAYPFRNKLEKVLIGATYQVIFKEEPYYRMPTWIFYPFFGYDALGGRQYDEMTDIPVQERYRGEDEMSTTAHLISTFLGSPITDDIDAGITISTVSHTRDGSYVHRRASEYGSTNDWEYLNHSERARTQNYDHFDFSGGIRYRPDRDWTLGATVGYLSGEADQSYLSVDSSSYNWGDSLTSDERWNAHIWNSVTDQNWSRDGNSTYFGLNFLHEYSRKLQFSGYYRYTKADIDLQSTSMIHDTSYYASRYVWDYNGEHRESNHWSKSATHDERTGTGTRDETTHQGMLKLRLDLTKHTFVNIGFFAKRSEIDMVTHEPVMAERWSDSHSEVNDTTAYDYYYRLYEDKSLDWRYSSSNWSVQVPVTVHVRVDDHFAMMFAINRILERWEITDRTLAYFDERSRDNGDSTKTETNFIEAYSQPTTKYTDDYFPLMATFEVDVSEQFKIKLMLDPSADDGLDLDQWWLSFALKL